ncbi:MULTISPECIES: hypothetical protein [unclassified Frankia]|uniref:hypothetical protein n=1 Tax=unclassified Frankia TaxID=2632575 RepID=UPI002AD46903|nr:MULTISPECIES: hypothetical protein [unclassified Frankia]
MTPAEHMTARSSASPADVAGAGLTAAPGTGPSGGSPGRDGGGDATQSLVVVDRAWDQDNPHDEEDKKSRAVRLTFRDELKGLLCGAVGNDPATTGKRAWDVPPGPTDTFILYFDDKTVLDVFVLLTWRGTKP